MKLPAFTTEDNANTISYGEFSHNRPMEAPAYNPSTPSKQPTSYGGKKGLEGRRAARKSYKKAAKTSKPGEGSRFEAVAKAAAASGAKNPGAVAGAAMWKKYGKKGGAALIKKGKQG